MLKIRITRPTFRLLSVCFLEIVSATLALEISFPSYARTLVLSYVTTRSLVVSGLFLVFPFSFLFWIQFLHVTYPSLISFFLNEFFFSTKILLIIMYMLISL